MQTGCSLLFHVYVSAILNGNGEQPGRTPVLLYAKLTYL